MKTKYQIAMDYLQSCGARKFAETPEVMVQAAKVLVTAWNRGCTSPHHFAQFAEHNWKTAYWIHQ